MNPPNDSGGSQPNQHPLSEAAKASVLKTHTLFRIFIVVVLGSFFVYQLDISYLWLTTILTAAAIVLGIMVLIRAVKYKESRLVLFGTISGIVVSAVMVLLILASALFFNQFRDYQQCTRNALTQQAASECRTQLEKSLPTQFR
ncbi:MAG: hypothetical protein JWO49_1614 [Arthrobacter sp.]|nr:hypothetical protein [Arthrobacter sp.]MCU1547485.1 hypothetical protein [Arthrobacter sp.]